jgi:hypothetical protein
MGAMKRLAAGLGAALIAAATPSSAQIGERDFRYGASISLIGSLRTEARFGAGGGDGEINDDQLETAFLLRLEEPITVIGDPSLRFNPGTVANIRELQLVRGEGVSFRAFVGRRVTAKGALFPRHSNHHHTDVLMMVSRIELLDP